MTQKLQKYVSKTRFDSKLAQANVVTKRNCDAKILDEVTATVLEPRTT